MKPCPDDCQKCSGEYCETHGVQPCDCDFIDRHEPPPIKCSRTACRVEIDADAPHYLIYNEPSTGMPRPYCVRCGRRIMEYNEHDEIKLRCEIVNIPALTPPTPAGEQR